jgi:hypothetical protein
VSYGHSGASAQLYKFPIPVRYCKGVVRINGFIGQSKVSFGVGNIRDTFKGDDRTFLPRSTAWESRASIELDFTRGLARLFVNYTCHDDGNCVSADPIGVLKSGGKIDITTATNWSGFNEISHHVERDRLELRWNWPNPASRQLGVAPCSIVGKLTVNFGLGGPTSQDLDLDDVVLRDFPSFEVYQFVSGRTEVLLQQRERDLPDLCARR